MLEKVSIQIAKLLIEQNEKPLIVKIWKTLYLHACLFNCWLVWCCHVVNSSDVTLCFEDTQAIQPFSREKTDNIDDTDGKDDTKYTDDTNDTMIQMIRMSQTILMIQMIRTIQMIQMIKLIEKVQKVQKIQKVQEV